jgi:hypothetical protein
MGIDWGEILKEEKVSWNLRVEANIEKNKKASKKHVVTTKK